MPIQLFHNRLVRQSKLLLRQHCNNEHQFESSLCVVLGIGHCHFEPVKLHLCLCIGNMFLQFQDQWVSVGREIWKICLSTSQLRINCKQILTLALLDCFSSNTRRINVLYIQQMGWMHWQIKSLYCRHSRQRRNSIITPSCANNSSSQMCCGILPLSY